MQPNPDRRYNIAVIGLGHRGYKTHFQNIAKSRSESVVAVCDAHAETLDSFRAKHPIIPAYSRVSELIANHKFDFAVVAVPHKYHRVVIDELAAAKIPVLKEKPAADSFEELDHFRSLPIKIGVTYQKRFEPRYLQFQQLLPRLGKVTSFRATLAMNIEDLESTWRATDNVGVTDDLGSHMIDLIVWLFGPPKSVTAHPVDKARRFQVYGGDDINNITMHWNGGANFFGHVHLSRVGHKEEESFAVTGTQGTLYLDGSSVSMLDSNGAEVFSLVDKASKQSIVQAMARGFGDYVTGASPDFSCSLEHLGASFDTLDRIRQSVKAADDVLYHQEEVSSLSGTHFVWPQITPGTVDAVVDQMHSSLSIYNRSNVYEAFEDKWREMHGMKYALTTSSGTAAIHSMFDALQLRPGDEVLAPVYTFFATATPMLQLGAIPVFCDSLPDGNLDPEEILRRATPKTKAVIVTHMWGLPCDMPQIVKNARKIGIKVLEDCSHAHGAHVGGKLVGSWGDIAAWSLQAKKNVTGGQAGVLATNSEDLYSRCILHGHFNKRAKQEVPENHPLRSFWLTGIGLNLRAHPLAIAMANHQLKSMPAMMANREKYARYLSSRLSEIPFLKLPTPAKGDGHAWYAYVMNFDSSKAPAGLTREAFVEALEKRGLKEVDIPRSTGLLHELPIFTETHKAIPRYGDKPWHAPQTGFRVAQEFFDTAIKLPMWVTDAEKPIVEYYANTFVSVAKSFLSFDQKKNRKVGRGEISARL